MPRSTNRQPPHPFPLVLVSWDDATELEAGWSDDLDDIGPHLATSVGFLIKRTKSHIVLAMDVDKDGMHNGRAQIPRGMVKHMKVLKRAGR